MQARTALLGGAVLIAGAIPGCRPRPDANVLMISVAVSLQNAMQDLQTLYGQTHAGAKLTFNFGSSGALEQQVEHGAPVDVFLSAAPKPMDALESQGLVAPGTRLDLLRNRIVLIAPKGSALPGGFAALPRPGVKLIAMGDPDSVPAGAYGRQVLIALKVWEQVRPKLVLAKDVRQVLSYVETGNADAGIVYRTDARESGRVEIAAVAPENAHSPVVYPVAVLKNSRNPNGAREFVHFLAGEQAAAVFVRHGFTTVRP